VLGEVMIEGQRQVNDERSKELLRRNKSCRPPVKPARADTGAELCVVDMSQGGYISHSQSEASHRVSCAHPFSHSLISPTTHRLLSQTALIESQVGIPTTFLPAASTLSREWDVYNHEFRLFPSES
jgi:hypothetical protein